MKNSNRIVSPAKNRIPESHIHFAEFCSNLGVAADGGLPILESVAYILALSCVAAE